MHFNLKMKKKRKIKFLLKSRKKIFYFFLGKTHPVAFQLRDISALSEVLILALESVWFNFFFFSSSSTKQICSFLYLLTALSQLFLLGVEAACVLVQETCLDLTLGG